MQQSDEPQPTAAAAAASAAAPASASTAHEIGYHAFLPTQLPHLRTRLLAWYDEHRRLLPWRGDPPAAVAASTDAAAAASASASSNDAFGAREKKARASAQQRKQNEANGVARFLLKPTSAGDAASSSCVAAEAGVAAAASPSATAPAAVSAAAPPAPRTAVSAYGVWVSEIMLQQTRVETVIDYYTRWMARFPTVESLAAASPDEVQRLWAGLGYYRRARFLQQGARDVVEKHGGALPNSVDGLLSISGIGPYTAGAIGSIAFGLQAPLVDGNVVRVMSRLRAMEVDPKARTTEAPMWALARAALDPARPGDWNQAVMELGATVCTPLSPACGRCPVNDLCYAAREVRQRRRPCELTAEERQGSAPSAALAASSSGAASASATSSTAAPVVIDIEELCDQSSTAPAAPSSAKSKGKTPRGKSATAAPDPFARPHDACSLCAPRDSPPDAVTAYPAKASKKAPLEQHVHVCAISRPSSASDAAAGGGGADGDPLYLIFRRPDTGLLAGQWELPSVIVPADATPADRSAAIERLLSTQLSLSAALVSAALVHAPAGLGELVHVFSHRKHLMRVTAATLDASAAGLNTTDTAALQATFCDRAVSGGSGAEAAAEPTATKKRVAASKAKGGAKRAKRAAAADSDDEGEKDADDSDADAEEAEGAKESDSASPRSYRWVSLSLLRQDHKMAGAGSELGLTSGVRKVVQLIGQGSDSGASASSSAAGGAPGAKRKPRPSKAAGSDPAAAPKKRAKKGAAQVQPEEAQSASATASPAPSPLPLPAPRSVEVIELDSDGDERMTGSSETAPAVTSAAKNVEVQTPPTAARGTRALRQSSKKMPAKPQASLHNFFAAAAAAPPRSDA